MQSCWIKYLLDNLVSFSSQWTTKRFSQRNISDALKGLYLLTFSFFQKTEAFEHRLYSHAMHKDPKLSDLYKQFEHKMMVSMKRKTIIVTAFRYFLWVLVIWMWIKDLSVSWNWILLHDFENVGQKEVRKCFI